MKRSVIRFFSSLLKLLIVLLGVYLCFHFYQRARGRYHTPAPVGLVQNTGTPYLDPAAFEAALQEEGIPFLTARTGDDGADAQALLDQGVKFLLVSLGQGGQAPALIAQAQKTGATILFLGLPPQESELKSYDKAWYLGSRAAYGGEVMGHALAEAFRGGALPDLSGDTLLQYRLYSEGRPDFAAELLDHTFEECEHYGVYSAAYSAGSAKTEEEEASLAGLDEFERQLLAQQQQEALKEAALSPELLLCVGAENQARARAEIEEYGWQTGGSAPFVASFATDRQQAEAFAQAGDGAVVYYDLEEATRLAALFARNLKEGEALAQGTGYFPDGQTFVVPYQLLE